MSTRTRRRRDREDWRREAATLARWGAMAGAVCLLAMAFVYLRNQQVLTGSRIRDQEQRIAQLRREIDREEIAILRLEERSTLRVRLEALAGPGAFTEIVPFQKDCILMPAAGPGEP